MIKFKFTSNTAKITRDLELFKKALLKLPQGISIWNDVEYAIFVELGTYKMAPRAMLRRSMPAIEQFFEAELKRLDVPFNFSQFRALLKRTEQFALETIKQNTPVRSGKLRAGWQSKITKRNDNDQND